MALHCLQARAAVVIGGVCELLGWMLKMASCATVLVLLDRTFEPKSVVLALQWFPPGAGPGWWELGLLPVCSGSVRREDFTASQQHRRRLRAGSPVASATATDALLVG